MTHNRKLLALPFLLLLAVSLCGFPSVEAFNSSPAVIVRGYLSNAVSALLKWLWSMKSTTKTAISGRPMMKFESGYTVETVFDGSKVGIEPYSVDVSPTGELLVLDSVNSNIYRMGPSFSKYSRPKLIAGSAEGYTGHVDGKPREARMNHPKGVTVDDKGNIYVADTMNMAIRKISESGVTTIAGGKWTRGAHADGPSEDAKFSNDFEVVYVGSSCSLLVIDRGNQAIREIQLYFDDCAYQYGSGFPLGIAVLLAAGFFGYMLALLQRRVGVMVSSTGDKVTPANATFPQSPYQKPPKASVRPTLIPTEEDSVKRDEEGLFSSVGKLLSGTSAFVVELLGFKNKRKAYRHQNQFLQQQQQPPRHLGSWPVQDSYVVPDEDEPPPPETRTPTPHKTYAFMAKDADKFRHFRQSRAYFNSWDGEQPLQHQQQQHIHQQQHQQQQHIHHQQHLQQQRHYSLGPQTFYEQSCETNEIVFGAVQESDNKRASVEIKAVDYGDSMYEQHGLRSRMNYTGYSYAY